MHKLRFYTQGLENPEEYRLQLGWFIRALQKRGNYYFNSHNTDFVDKVQQELPSIQKAFFEEVVSLEKEAFFLRITKFRGVGHVRAEQIANCVKSVRILDGQLYVDYLEDMTLSNFYESKSAYLASLTPDNVRFVFGSTSTNDVAWRLLYSCFVQYKEEYNDRLGTNAKIEQFRTEVAAFMDQIDDTKDKASRNIMIDMFKQYANILKQE